MQSRELDPHVAWDNGDAHDAFAVDTIPYNVVITADGAIRADVIGGLRMSDILQPVAHWTPKRKSSRQAGSGDPSPTA